MVEFFDKAKTTFGGSFIFKFSYSIIRKAIHNSYTMSLWF